MAKYIKKNGVLQRLLAIPSNFPASLISFIKSGTSLNANNAQDAIAELDSTKVKKSGDTMTGILEVNASSATTQARFNRNHTSTTSDASDIVIGNNIADGTAGSCYGRVLLWGKGTKKTFLSAPNATSDRTIELPNSSGTIALTSDISSRKYKENILPLSENECKKLLDIEVVTFDYKEDVVSDNERLNNRGVIAEQVEPIIPYVVEHETIEDEEQMRVDYRKFIPYLIKMVQIQQKEIDELKAIIENRP